MTVRLGLPAKLVATDASDTRMDWRNLVTRNADGTIRTGLTWPAAANQQLVTATASTGPMTVQVAAFDATAARDGGAVFLCNDGITPASGAGSVVIAAAPAAGSSRQDVVYTMQHDNSGGVTAPDADNLPGMFVATGAPTTGTPTKPAIPAAAVELATVLVPSGVTATNGVGVVITQTAQFTASAGGSVPFPTSAALVAWSTARDGQRAYALDTDQLFVNLAGAPASWELIGGRPSLNAVNFTTIYASWATSPVTLALMNGRCTLEGALTITAGATFAAGTSYAVGSVPVGLAPAKTQTFIGSWGGTGVVTVTIAGGTGAVSIMFTTAPGTLAAGGIQVWLSGMSWRVATV